ncbi:hypothetical protein AGR5A_Cc70242 [Agrobacterium genomosp. 5 str. CFBP 6626]|nr:hypothetical protein AGR5A_Cc70242 [Agrobacterium genomosp. 5 str. CFBP 6626]
MGHRLHMTLTGLFCGFRFRSHGYEHAAVGLRAEVHVTCGQCENRVVLADADIGARMPLRAALTQNNVAWNDGFAAELLYAKALGFGIATVTRGTASFFVCHWSSPLNLVSRVAPIRQQRCP